MLPPLIFSLRHYVSSFLRRRDSCFASRRDDDALWSFSPLTLEACAFSDAFLMPLRCDGFRRASRCLCHMRFSPLLPPFRSMRYSSPIFADDTWRRQRLAIRPPAPLALPPRQAAMPIAPLFADVAFSATMPPAVTPAIVFGDHAITLCATSPYADAVAARCCRRYRYFAALLPRSRGCRCRRRNAGARVVRV